MTIKELETLKELLEKAVKEANNLHTKAFYDTKYLHCRTFFRIYDECDDALNVLKAYGGYLTQEDK